MLLTYILIALTIMVAGLGIGVICWSIRTSRKVITYTIDHGVVSFDGYIEPGTHMKVPLGGTNKVTLTDKFGKSIPVKEKTRRY